jgi:drug/metabolite transporter (DMT)-like permease
MRQFLPLTVIILLNVTGQYLMKSGMNAVGVIAAVPHTLGGSILRIATNPHVVGGLLCYVASTALWLVVLSRTNLSWAYPIISLGYVLTVLVSCFALGEHVSMQRWLGVVIICVGIFFVATSS